MLAPADLLHVLPVRNGSARRFIVARPVRTARRLVTTPRLRRVGVPQYPPGTVRWGSLRRTTPLSRSWGYDRGTPIDRAYIEQFLASHSEDVRGACLEVLNADYTHRFGGERVTSSDVLDINPANTAATIVADLGEPDSLAC